MAIRQRFSRKKLKTPDQFLSTTDHILNFVQGNQGLLISVTAAILIILGVFWGVRYTGEVEALEMESRLFEITKIAREAKDKPLAEIIPRVEKSLQDLDEGSQKLRGRLLLADLYYQNKQYDQAVKLFTEVIQRTEPGGLNQALARIGLAHTYQAGKQYKKAIETYKTAIEQPASLPQFYAYLDLARSYESDQDSKNALLILRETKNKFPGHREIGKVDLWIHRLEQGV